MAHLDRRLHSMTMTVKRLILSKLHCKSTLSRMATQSKPTVLLLLRLLRFAPKVAITTTLKRSKNLKDAPDKKRRKNTSTMKTGCKFRVSAARQRDMPWTVKIFNNHHNHEPVEASSALPQHRIAAMSEEERSLVGSMH